MIFKAAYFIFFTFAVFLRFFMRKKVLGMKKEKGRVVASWTERAMFYSYVIMLFATLMEFAFLKRHENINFYVTGTGLFIYLFGITARNWALKTLDKYWSLNIELRNGQELIKRGPYRYLRHPNYFCHSLEVLGFPLIANSWYAFMFVLFVYIPVIMARTYIEDNELAKMFGEKYLNYRREVWALFPIPIGKKGVKKDA